MVAHTERDKQVVQSRSALYTSAENLQLQVEDRWITKLQLAHGEPTGSDYRFDGESQDRHLIRIVLEDAKSTYISTVVTIPKAERGSSAQSFR